MAYELHMCYYGNTFFISGTGDSVEYAKLVAEGDRLLKAQPAPRIADEKVDENAYMLELARLNSGEPEPAPKPKKAKVQKELADAPAVVIDPATLALGN